MKKLFSTVVFYCLCTIISIAQMPVAYYPFNGNANDAIGALNGTVSGATLAADRFGNANKAYSFDGVNDFISTTAVATTNTDNYTMCAWVKPSSIFQNDGTIMMNGFDDGFTGNGYAMLMGNGSGGAGSIFTILFCGVTYFNTGTAFGSNNTWYHVATVRNAGITQTYINGIPSFLITGTEPKAPSGSLRIGSCTGNRFFAGTIDDVLVYDKALTAQQISDLANNVEVCNGIDDDGDGLIDENITTCSKPTGLGVSNISSTSATVSWNSVPCAVSYQLQGRKKGSTTWQTFTTSETSKTFNGLTPNTIYEGRILTICRFTPLLASDYTAIVSFKTAASGPSKE